MTTKWIILLLTVALTTGCLKTRSELAGGKSGSSSSEARTAAGGKDQQQRAQIDTRFYEIDRDFRQLYGKIEAIEQKLNDLQAKPGEESGEKAAPSKDIKKLEKRIQTLEEALLSLDKKLTSMKRKGASTTKRSRKSNKNPYVAANSLYAKKDWKQAISAFDSYRKTRPRGKNYADATFKMGVCFEKLNMSKDAKAFFQEVVERFPNTKVAKQAQTRLKSI